ncbi:MAG: FAD-binding oxidoreductase [Flavobacteriales bacterium]|nr:FAD-binding oxidoreductase [Flavobacteriales bacterium]
MIPFSKLSFWEKESYLSKVDFLIIGSGIVGLSTAIHLKQQHPNKKVLVLERGYLPTGASTKNAGFACIGSASELLDDLENQDASMVFSTVEQRWKGLHYLRSMLGDQNIDYLNLGSHELFLPKEKQAYQNCLDHLDHLNQELKPITGLSSTYQPAEKQCKISGFMGFSQAISNAAEGQIDTGKMMQSLLKLAHSLEVNVLNGISVQEITDTEVSTNHGKISFQRLAICTNGLAKQFLPEEDVKPVRAQVVVTSPIPNLKVQGTYHFDKGYYYFRNIGNRMLFGGGRNLDFEAEETDELNTSNTIINHLSHLLESQILPHTSFNIEQHWAGTMGVGKAKSPIVKEVRENIYCGVRLGGMGVAIGSITGKNLANLIIR